MISFENLNIFSRFYCCIRTLYEKDEYFLSIFQGADDFDDDEEFDAMVDDPVVSAMLHGLSINNC